MAVLTSFLGRANIRRIVQLQRPQFQNDGGIWGRRLNDVPATDEEIIARESNLALAADIVGDDGVAPAKTMSEMEAIQIKVANLKRHIPVKASDMALWDRIERGGLLPGDGGTINGRLGRMTLLAERGVRILRGVVCAAVVLNKLSYDRHGIKLPNLTFGGYTGLNVTPTAWSNPSAATPVADIQALVVLASEQYGSPKNRLTLSRQAWNYMIATDEFQAKTRSMYPLLSSTTVLPGANDPRMVAIAASVLGLEQIEINDDQYKWMGADGVIQTGRYAPANVAVLTNTADDNNDSTWDFANSITLESIGAGAFNILRDQFPNGPEAGPSTYFAPANSNLNPPQGGIFSVQRGMGRRIEPAASATLTVF